jgi:hypothetical protein
MKRRWMSWLLAAAALSAIALTSPPAHARWLLWNGGW